MKILVADDDSVTRKLIEAVLTRSGHEVQSFADGQALWEAYEADPAPLIVTDWMMPRMSGVEVARHIRRQKSVSYAHVVLVTSLSPAEHTIEAYQAGVDDFVGKPFKASEITERVAAVARSVLAQSEQALRQALEITQHALGAEHAALLAPLHALASIARQQESFARCRSFIRRQLAIATQAFGADDPRARKLADELEELRSLQDAV